MFWKGLFLLYSVRFKHEAYTKLSHLHADWGRKSYILWKFKNLPGFFSDYILSMNKNYQPQGSSMAQNVTNAHYTLHLSSCANFSETWMRRFTLSCVVLDYILANKWITKGLGHCDEWKQNNLYITWRKKSMPFINVFYFKPNCHWCCCGVFEQRLTLNTSHVENA